MLKSIDLARVSHTKSEPEAGNLDARRSASSGAWAAARLQATMDEEERRGGPSLQTTRSGEQMAARAKLRSSAVMYHDTIISLSKSCVVCFVEGPEAAERADSPVPSCVSIKSDRSMDHPKQRVQQESADSPGPSCVSSEEWLGLWIDLFTYKDGNHLLRKEESSRREQTSPGPSCGPPLESGLVYG
ncbi:hypothetical protein N1851_013024 [Merluccius polli]|uniref:Uncharacterized protein n=1 Tax=Merluccius polli TaxID=89951 RepID=A0AA47P5L3_MERPO|nr:hypothetical protein N1851_013024 [Merluccius polli]